MWGDYYDVELNEDGYCVDGIVVGVGLIDIIFLSNGGLEDIEVVCSDGVDNDGDLYVDCDDFDCSDIMVCGGENN